MKSMIWKELRENLKWAALAFFCLLLAEAFTLSLEREMIGNRFDDITLCSSAFLMVSAFGCSAIGAALGALQILPELRRDQWASLLHRPIPRHVILLGKVAAGLVLYGLATGLPLLASIAYVALPGRFPAPFVPGLAAPAASDLLLGIVFYFAAILLGLHSGRWFGSRGAIALAPVAVMTIHLAGDWPFALPLGAAVVLFIAAWGAILGSVALRPWITRLALGVVILTGAGAAFLFVGMPLRTGSQSAIMSDGATSFYIAHDGAVLRWKRDGGLVDEQGHDVPDERYGDNSGRYSLYPHPFANRARPGARRFDRGSRSSNRDVELVAGSHTSPEFWYLIDGPRSYFIGYDTLSARCIGICDADGFKSPAAIPRPFASEPQREPLQAPPIVFWVGSQIFAADFADRRLTPLLDVGGDTIYGVLKFPYTSNHPRVAVALSSIIRILDLTGAPIFTLPYGHDARHSPEVSITATDDFSRMFLVYTQGIYSILRKQDAAVHLDVMDVQGRRIAVHTIAHTDVTTPPPPPGARIADLLNMPVPALLAVSWARHHEFYSVFGNFGATMLTELDHREFYALFTLAIILSGLACLWARRAGLSAARTVTWITLTLLFGLAGFLAYRLSTHWPALVRCPRCAQRRPVAASSCPHCHAAWEPLPPTGAEIFDLA